MILFVPAVRIVEPSFHRTVRLPWLMTTHVNRESDPSVTITGWVRLFSSVRPGNLNIKFIGFEVSGLARAKQLKTSKG